VARAVIDADLGMKQQVHAINEVSFFQTVSPQMHLQINLPLTSICIVPRLA